MLLLYILLYCIFLISFDPWTAYFIHCIPPDYALLLQVNHVVENVDIGGKHQGYGFGVQSCQVGKPELLNGARWVAVETVK